MIAPANLSARLNFLFLFFLHGTLNFVDGTCKDHSWAGYKLVFFLKKGRKENLTQARITPGDFNFYVPIVTHFQP